MHEVQSLMLTIACCFDSPFVAYRCASYPSQPVASEAYWRRQVGLVRIVDQVAVGTAAGFLERCDSVARKVRQI